MMAPPPVIGRAVAAGPPTGDGNDAAKTCWCITDVQTMPDCDFQMPNVVQCWSIGMRATGGLHVGNHAAISVVSVVAWVWWR
jgi:hypothetical protein